MKVLTLGYKEPGGLRFRYGRGEYIDVSDSFQDVMAVEADVVAVNISITDASTVDKIRKYELASAGETGIVFLYQNREDIENDSQLFHELEWIEIKPYFRGK